MAVDSSGFLYVADWANHCIRKITPEGKVTTLAGSGEWGYKDATDTAAQFYHPHGVAVDSSGNVYVAELHNHCIRKITPAGKVTTLAGSTQGYQDATGTAAQFSFPTGVAVDSSGNLYVAEANNHRIRKITSGGDVTVLAGAEPTSATPGAFTVWVGTRGYVNGTGTDARFNLPSGVAVDLSGNVYVADHSNNRIRKITPTGDVTVLAGSSCGDDNGTGTAAKFNSPPRRGRGFIRQSLCGG